MDGFFLILRVAVSLAAVLGLIWFINRRWSGRATSASAHAVTMIGRQALGQKSSVAVVDIDDRRYVLGVAEQSVTLLESYPAPDPPEVSPASSSGRHSVVSRGFEQKLRSAVALAQGRTGHDRIGSQASPDGRVSSRNQDPHQDPTQ
ncbi:FliO/MopB family protein [Nesterenkonia halotolerans]|uniref:Flagellar protein FliO/FliZ n=1 Tax=Nesterenkonia halotolerans TaxID=225325 RepID=A0ABR9J5X6_9MICC|nr:flagellar biosynthetic protein FliO [Nesterenkonia halotolerans]MBE1514395.1 flagellar protein FliO/FliZ [Nesterenkonia halotolerans]